MKKTHKVVMLSTEKATGLFIQTMNIWGDPVYAKRRLEYTTNDTLIRNNHLISNRKAATNALNKYSFNHLYIVSNEPAVEGDWITNSIQIAQVNCLTVNDPNKHLHEKVIASTDESLGYPVIPPAFIEAYVKAYNNSSPITEVSLEYDCDHTQMPNKVIDVIKTRADNTVIIHQAKNYTRDDVIKLTRDAWNAGTRAEKDSRKYGEYTPHSKWVEDNLK